MVQELDLSDPDRSLAWVFFDWGSELQSADQMDEREGIEDKWFCIVVFDFMGIACE